MQTLKIRKVGNSLGVTFPKEVLTALNVSEGDELYVTEAEGGFLVTPYDPDFNDAMAAFEVTRKNYRNALHELAR